MVWAGNETTVPVFYWLNLKGQFCGGFIPRVSWMILWILLLKHWWVYFLWSPSRYLNRFVWSFYAPLHFTCFELLGRLLTFSCTLWRFSHRAWGVVLWPRPILRDSTKDLQSMRNIVYRKASSVFCMQESGNTSICGKTQFEALVSIPAFHLSSSFHHLHSHRHLFSYTFGSKTNLSLTYPHQLKHPVLHEDSVQRLPTLWHPKSSLTKHTEWSPFICHVTEHQPRVREMESRESCVCWESTYFFCFIHSVLLFLCFVSLPQRRALSQSRYLNEHFFLFEWTLFLRFLAYGFVVILMAVVHNHKLQL